MTSSATTIQSKAAYRLCLAAGLVILALTALSSSQEPPPPCGDLRDGYAPIIAFELARSEADLQAVFGTPSDPCRADMIARMDAINWIDVLVFVPVYGVFMASFFFGIRARNARLAHVGVQLTIVAVLADYVENACLMSLTPQLDASSGWFALLPWATAVKWLALGAAAAVAALIYLNHAAAGQRRIWRALAALASGAAFLVSVAAVAAPAAFGPVLSLGIAGSWLVFLLTAGMEAFSAAPKSGPAESRP